MSVMIGWWIIPLIITIFAISLALRKSKNEGTFSHIINPLFGAAELGFTILISLVSWIIWGILVYGK